MSLTNLKKSANRVQEALLEKGLDFKVIQLDASTHTAQDAAKAIGCDVAQIIKSLIFCTSKTHTPILVLASGINRVDEKKLTTHLGEEVKKADADFIRDVTGYAIGGVPPIAHKTEMKTLIDADLIQYDELWAAAGTPNAVFCLNSSMLQSLTKGIILDIKLT
jgi:Cys-tRNA(Pro) deacylase